MAGSFPTLSMDEVIDSCKQLFQVQISEEDLRKPSSHFVRKFYLEAVTAILHATPELMTQPHFNVLSEFQHSEIFEDGAALVYFAMLLQRFMHACMVPDFSLVTDLMNPKPKRTLNCISAIINFQKFKASQDHHYDAAMLEKEALYEQKNQLLVKNEELRRKIAQIKAARADDEEKIQQIVPEVDNLERVVHELNRQQAADAKEIQQLKTMIAERSSKEAEIKVTNANDVEECEKIKAQIVTSPEKFRGEISRLNKAIDSCKASIAEKIQKLQGLKNQVESVNMLEENARQAVKLIASVEEEAGKLRALQNEVQDLHDVCTSDDEALREQIAKLQNLKRQDASQMEKMARLETKNEKKMSSIKFVIDQAGKDKETWRENAMNFQADVVEMDQKCQELLKTLEDKENDHGIRMANMKKGYEELLAGLETYHSSLQKGWEELAKSLMAH